MAINGLIRVSHYATCLVTNGYIVGGRHRYQLATLLSLGITQSHQSSLLLPISPALHESCGVKIRHMALRH